MKADSLGDRMKQYERITKDALISKLPVIVRVDGRAFHTFTRQAYKPYDSRIIQWMEESAKIVAEDMQNFIMAYVQSDEATFVMNNNQTLDSQPWFGNDKQKIVSISAATMTAAFNLYWFDYLIEKRLQKKDVEKSPVFDSRAFNIPDFEVANCFYWRYKDWIRNSVQMFARAHFSQKQLEGKSREDMHQMLHEVGHNWTTEATDQERNGTFILNRNGKLEVYVPSKQLTHKDIQDMYTSILEERIKAAQQTN